MRVARETITKLIDDIDGGTADETVTFGLDGVTYEIDLSKKNADKLRNALKTYVENGSRSDRRVARGRGAGRPRGSAAADREQNKAIRAWAKRKRLDVAPRGRIKAAIVEQYHREVGR